MDREKIRKRIVSNIVIDEHGCWIWKGNARENGYCRSSFFRKNMYIHRASYYAFIGDIPSGHDVCHKCDVRSCCNPSHLFSGTRKENMMDAVKKGRQAKRNSLPHCKIKESDIGSIMKRVYAGETYREIALDYGVTRHTIGNIARKKGVYRYGK